MMCRELKAMDSVRNLEGGLLWWSASGILQRSPEVRSGSQGVVRPTRREQNTRGTTDLHSHQTHDSAHRVGRAELEAETIVRKHVLVHCIGKT